MTPSPESPNFTDATPPVEAADAVSTETAVAIETPEIGSADDDAAGRYGRVRGQRLEITSADLTMYSAITGRAPSREERQRALTWSEADPMHEQIADRRGVTLPPRSGSRHGMAAVLPMHSPWHPAALSVRIRDLWFNGLTLRSPRPQLNHWARRLSTALSQGRQRVKQPR